MLLSKALDNFTTSKVGVAKPATIDWYHKRLKSLVEKYGQLDITEVKPEHLDRWRAGLASRQTRYDDHPTRPSVNTRGLSAHTLHGHVRAARSFFRFCFRRGYVERNPATDLAFPPLPNQPPKHITDEDIDRLLAAAEGNPRDYALVITLANSGCRIGGLKWLKWDDVDLDAGAFEVREKFNCVNEYYLVGDARAALRDWREECGCEVVFPNSRTGKQLSYHGLYLVVKRLARKAGIEKRWNPHSFRHHKARELLDNGASLETVAEILHHKDVGTTAMFYARWTRQEVKKKHDRFSRQRYPG